MVNRLLQGSYKKALSKVVDARGMNKYSDRALELAAKKALSLWRYPEEAGGDKFLEIEFEFNLEQ